MLRREKETVVAELRERFARASVALVASNRGLTVKQATEFRKAIRRASGEYKVAKHTLTRRALAGSPYQSLEPFLVGPRGLVFGYDDPIAVAKALVGFAKEVDQIGIEGGAVEGQPIDAARVRELAELPGLDALRAAVARQVLAPGRRLAALVRSPGATIAGQIEALVRRKQEASEASS